MTHNFFVYCPNDGFDDFETLDAALDDAADRVQGYLEDGWSEDVTGVCVGEITHRAKMCDQVFPDGEIDADGIDEAGDYWDPDWEYKCNYKMLPVKKQSPAHDAAAPEVEQKPVAWARMKYGAISRVFAYRETAEFLSGFAANEVVPLYLNPQPAPEAVKLVEALEGILSIVYDSDGASGYHLNGDIAKWCEFEEVAAAEEALAAFRKQGDEIPMHPCVMQLDKVGDV